ncbi:MAG: hypothetical protein HQL21_08095 [Candidatus Omnitrophica bacterium]|nr:hypothetical protein [Candidatus Omnitrophota bacterium]
MTPEGVKKLCSALAVLMFAAGGLGSVACLPYALGNDIAWVTATGVYFIAGAVMMTGGLVSGVLLMKTE